MNKQTLEFITLVLHSELSKTTKEEIVRFYSLPRNTPVKPALEFDEEEEEVEGVDRPGVEEIELNDNPDIKAGLKETGKLLKKAEE